MIKVYVIDDHPLFIDGLRSVFEDKLDGIDICHYSTSGSEAILKLKSEKVDVVILDLMMKGIDGLDLMLIIRQNFPDTKTIAITASTDPWRLLNVWSNGVDGLLTKDCGKTELMSAINAVLSGDRYIGRTVPSFPSRRLLRKTSPKFKLTTRETQVLNLLAKSFNRKEISQILGVSKQSIDFHCRNIYKTFNNNNMDRILEDAIEAKTIVI